MKLWIGLCCAVAVSGAAMTPAAGAEPAAEKPATLKVVLHAAAAPVPALKYQLLPPIIERRPGNAAVDYGKVTAEQNAFFGNQQLQDKIAKWLEGPLDKFPKEEVRQEFKPPLYFLRLASRCESCDWQLPIRDEMFFMIRLPELQQLRNFGRILALQARLHVAFGEYDQAIEMLQMGFALGRHAGQQPTLVGGLVGMSIHRQMCERVLEMSQQPEAPNVYWAITTLPRPMIDLRGAVETEMYSLYLSFPQLRELDSNKYPQDYWTARLEKVLSDLAVLEEMQEKSDAERLFTTARLMKGYPQARKWLLDRGRTAKDVDNMSPLHTVFLYTMHTYDELRDDCMKWMFLPYSESIAGLRRAEKQLQDAKVAQTEIIPLANLLLPAMVAVKNAEVRAQRQFAVLQVLSALRLFAAQQGRLPANLAEVTDIPLPLDPVSGAPFQYRGEGPNSAVLELASLPGKAGSPLDIARYEIELKPPAAK